jgi:transcriptional regulator with XRE-family HTH domain
MTTIVQTRSFAPIVQGIPRKKTFKVAGMDPADLARRIRTARAWAGLSQSELAEALEVSESTLARWEKGQKLPSRAEVFYLAEVCGVRRAFFTDEDPGISVLGDPEQFAREIEKGARAAQGRRERGEEKGSTD